MYDIIIIGAGPAGISMAAEAIHSGIAVEKILIIEKAAEHSFTIKKFYPENKLVTANYKGFAAACTGVMCLTDSTKEQTVSFLDKVIAENNLTVNYNETVYKISRDEQSQLFTLVTDKLQYESKVIVVSVGILGKPNKPDYKIPIALNEKILYDLTSKEIRSSKVLVVGGGDSASEYCQYLVQCNNEVTLSYRQNEFTRMNSINKESLLQLQTSSKLKLLLGTNISSVEDDAGKPKVIFTDSTNMTFDSIVYALGGSTPENFLKLIGIDFDGPNPVLKEGYETSVPGMFLTGDLSAGKKGGSIIWAFNSSNTAMKRICENYLECHL
ncbi:MAG: NAD(P)-binding domain-containing protein [Ignavibacteriales bacterium]|nr:MAG: NAD(P)-binding domain-containing protein [Ignavibacteriales bacterium]